MSFEPTIIIYKPDLDKAQAKILSFQYGKKKVAKTDRARYIHSAYDRLESLLLDKGTFTIKGIEMLLVNVEFTATNRAFRDVLDDLNIEHAITI